MTSNNTAPIPEGYVRNSQGHLVLLEDVPELTRQKDQLAREILAQGKEMSANLAALKDSWLETIAAHIQIAAEQYNVSIGGESGAVTLTSFDGSIKVERQYSRMLIVNERASIAKELIERYAEKNSANLTGDAKPLVRAALRVDEKGKLSATALLSLARKIKSTDPEWQAAVSAINDAVTTEYGDPYVRIYERDEHGNYQQIMLDLPTA